MKRSRKKNEGAALFVVLVVLFAFFSIASPFFFSDRNVIVILQQSALIGMIVAEFFTALSGLGAIIVTSVSLENDGVATKITLRAPVPPKPWQALQATATWAPVRG